MSNFNLPCCNSFKLKQSYINPRYAAADPAEHFVRYGARLDGDIVCSNPFIALASNQHHLIPFAHAGHVRHVQHGHIHAYPPGHRHSDTPDNGFTPVREAAAVSVRIPDGYRGDHALAFCDKCPAVAYRKPCWDLFEECNTRYERQNRPQSSASRFSFEGIIPVQHQPRSDHGEECPL